MARLYFGPGFRHTSGSDVVESDADGFAEVPSHLESDPALTQHIKPQGAPVSAPEEHDEHDEHAES